MAGKNADQNSEPVLTDALRSITRTVAAAPKISLLMALMVTGACVALTVCYLDFKTERSDLIDPDAAFHRRWLKFTETFGDNNDLIAVVEADDPRLVRATLQDLGERLKRDSEPFTNVLYRIEPGSMRRKGLQYLSPRELESVLRSLEQYRVLSQGRSDVIELNNVVRKLAWQLNSTNGQTARNTTTRLISHAETFSDSLDAFLSDRDQFRSPWPEMLAVDDRFVQESIRTVYFVSDSGRLGFLRAQPIVSKSGFNGASVPIDRMREICADVMAQTPGVSVGVTGIPVLESDEMRRSQQDMLKASAISFVGVGILLFFGFRGLKHPILALIMLAFGLAWAFGFTTFSVGHLNILSVSFAVILIGLGIDFGIHYIARYLEHRKEGYELDEALEETSSGVGTGIITAAVTTALAFFCATFTQFLGVAELGIIAGGGILLCALATFVILPPLIALADADSDPEKLPGPSGINWVRFGASRFPMVVAILSIAVIAGLGSQIFKFEGDQFIPRVKYDYNLLNLQADGVESVDVQKKVFKEGFGSLLFAVAIADTAEEARRMHQEFASLPSVGHVEELASRLPSYPPDQTRVMVQAVKAELARLPRSVSTMSAPNPSSVGYSLEQLLMAVRRQSHPEASRVSHKLDLLLDRFERMSMSGQAQYLREYQGRMTRSLFAQFGALAAAADPQPLTFADLPTELTSRFVSPEGKWLLQIYPKDDVWEIEPLTRFVEDIRSVDPDVTGTPLQNYEASRQIMRSYETAALYALAVISLVLLMDFLQPENKLLTLAPPLVVVAFTVMTLLTRGIQPNPSYVVIGYLSMVIAVAAILDFNNLRDAALTLLPPITGGILMFGVLAILEIHLNPANLIVLPLVLGIGVDDGVHVVHDYRMQKRTGKYQMSPSTVNAIVLTSLTSMVGFGSLMVASHRGLYSVGLVLVIGIASCLFVSLVLLPAVLTLITGGPVRSPKKRRGGDSSDYGDEEDLEAATRPEGNRRNRRAA
ncbi:MMPL family transporter [Calycomorphotria hydatis]|uniref:Membrane transport protein mmpL8 n=1 Tax=Calycomorphotria hydatis TaxID=2528027 RepID=A0A517TB01_9PLAN|nr:MMPL family transporter [Calycomorphotria hydatis]QDT65545.1 Membrane transport protein mmpL8 [Calycomorphotria hydatis]